MRKLLPILSMVALLPLPATVATAATGSPGCGSSTVEPGQTSDMMESGGLERRWELRVPPAHDGTTPVPLVIQLHGYSVDPAYQERLSQFGQLGEERGFVTVSPYGRGSPRRWVFDPDEVTYPPTLANPDAAFISDLIDRLGGELCLDQSRIYATGFSNGAEAVAVLACALEHRIAAFAPVSGYLDQGDACELDRPVPLLVVHGTDDGLTPFEGIELPEVCSIPADCHPGLALSVPERVAAAAERNGCAGEPEAANVTEHVERFIYDCPTRADVVFYVIHGDGHTWPGPAGRPFGGLGNVTDEIDATGVIWDFFMQHSQPAP